MANLSKIAEALCLAQAEMSGAKKDKQNPFYKSSYADLASVFNAIKGPFANNGLCVTQTMDILENGHTALKTTLMHKSGEHIESKMILPAIADPQKLGSCISYYRRYSLMAIAGIPAEDDDGNSASKAVQAQPQKLAAWQVKKIQELAGEDIEYLENLVEWAGVTTLGDITAEKYPAILKSLNKKNDEAAKAVTNEV